VDNIFNDPQNYIDRIDSLTEHTFLNTIDQQIKFSPLRLLKALYFLKQNNRIYAGLDFDRSPLSPELLAIVKSEICDIHIIENEENKFLFDTSLLFNDNPTPNSGDEVNFIQKYAKIEANSFQEYVKEDADPDLFAKSFVHLFPFATGHPGDVKRPYKISLKKFILHSLRMKDSRFRDDKQYLAYTYSYLMRSKSKGVVTLPYLENLKFNSEDPEDAHKFLLRKFSPFYEQIKGSKPYWIQKRRELMSMVDSLGSPTFFITLSPADMYWPELFISLGVADPSTLTNEERRKLLNANPVPAAQHFHLRMKAILETIILNNKSKLFTHKVANYWYRIEFQARGSPHIHMLIWLENAPDLISTFSQNSSEDNLIQKELIKWIDSIICSCLPDHYPDEQDHPNSVYERKIHESIIHTPLSGNYLKRLLEKVQVHDCTRSKKCMQKKNASISSQRNLSQKQK
jgi:hypothetical protein